MPKSRSRSRSPTPSPSHTVHHIGSANSVMPAARTEALEWSSVVRAHKLTVEHAAFEIKADRVLYHMELELATPLPADALEHGQFLCLSWPYGGLWRIERIRDRNTKVVCLAWRKTLLTHEQVDLHALAVNSLASKVQDKTCQETGKEGSGEDANANAKVSTNADLLEPEEEGEEGEVATNQSSTESQQVADDERDLPTLFEWKMLCGDWGADAHHWFIHDIETLESTTTEAPPLRRELQVKLFVGFAPLQAQIEVNAVTAIDTIAQTYAADVTWQVTLPAITTFREDAVLLEFLDILEIDTEQFEFSNVTDMKENRDLSSSVTPAGYVQFKDPVAGRTKPVSTARLNIEPVYHLQFSRRVTALFTEEMALHSFPFDQQKLIFEFTTGISGMPDGALQLIPAPVEPGIFSVENFQLGNVFNVAYHNKIFVSEIKESGPRKTIAFEMVLERKSAYYITNVALISAIITYLCFFVSWAPTDKEGNSMETGTRLQNVTAMVLTAVTFKNQVASLIPQISYFTILDSYVFVCFMVTSFVTVENALYPLCQKWFGEIWDETSLLGYSLLLFTLLNLVWGAYLRRWLKRRRRAAKVLMQVHEYIRVITDAIPPRHRVEVLRRFLETQKYAEWCEPQYVVTSNGDIHVQAPDDIPVDTVVRRVRHSTAARRLKRVKLVENQKTIAESTLPIFQEIYADLRPTVDRHTSAPVLSSPVAHPIPAARTTATAYQAGTRRLSRMASAVPVRRGNRSVSEHRGGEDTVVNIESFRRFRDRLKDHAL